MFFVHFLFERSFEKCVVDRFFLRELKQIFTTGIYMKYIGI